MQYYGVNHLINTDKMFLNYYPKETHLPGGSGESAEGHGRSNFVRGKGAVATVIRHEWQERERVGGEDHRQQMIGARQGTSVFWDRDR